MTKARLDRKGAVIKPGDRIRCVDDSRHPWLNNGDEFTVNWVGGYGCLEVIEHPATDLAIDRFRRLKSEALRSKDPQP